MIFQHDHFSNSLQRRKNTFLINCRPLDSIVKLIPSKDNRETWNEIITSCLSFFSSPMVGERDVLLSKSNQTVFQTQLDELYRTVSPVLRKYTVELWKRSLSCTWNNRQTLLNQSQSEILESPANFTYVFL